MTKNNKKSVIYIVENLDNAQFRYRVENVLEALEKSKKWSGRYYLKNEIQRIDLNEIRIIVIGRQTEKGIKLLSFIKKAQKHGIKVLFDLDDLVFDYRDLRMVSKTVREKNIIYWAAYFFGIRKIAKRVDGFLTTNNFLASKLKQAFKKPAKVIRNSLNQEQVEISEKILQRKEPRSSLSAKFLIGYFSGSPTHKKDFQIIEPELTRFLKTHVNAKLRIVGYMDFSKQMKKLVNTGQADIIAPVDYRKLQYLVSDTDVNIAPLVINDFTNCKSELKFFESAVVETTTIASPNYTFKHAITDGENGFLAQSGKWYDKLEYLYNHPKESKKIAKKAKEYAMKHYYGEEFLKEVEGVYDYFAK